MKHIRILTTTTFLSIVASPLFAQENNFIEDFLERLENSSLEKTTKRQ